MSMSRNRCTSHNDVDEMQSSTDAAKSYRVTIDACNCLGFRYNGDCKHHKKFLNDHCLWDELVDEGIPIDDRCPFCKREIEEYEID